MRLPNIQMSTGAWVFATGVAVALIASPSIYAAATSVVAIGNPSGNATAFVTQTRQLQTAVTAPNNVVFAAAAINVGQCGAVYTPPAGKAIVITQITYALGSGIQGTENDALLSVAGCPPLSLYDVADTIQRFEAQSHTFPTGLPMPSVAVEPGGQGTVTVTLTGYLIPATALPSEAPQVHGPIRAMLGR